MYDYYSLLFTIMKIFFKTLNKQQDLSLHHFATSSNSSNNKKSIQFRLNSLRIMINNRIINPLSRNKKKKKTTPSISRITHEGFASLYEKRWNRKRKKGRRGMTMEGKRPHTCSSLRVIQRTRWNVYHLA